MSVFTKYHLVVSREAHQARAALAPRNDLNILEVRPDYDIFAQLIDRVGGPWGWTRRPRYLGSNRRFIEGMMKRPHTRLFLLRRGREAIGYCLTAVPRELPPALGAPPNPFMPEIIEIENFGLFPEQTGQKYGQYFLHLLFDRLFDVYGTVYLSTRSTNHPRVVPFYESCGMRLVKEEILPDDLAPLEKDIPVYESL